MLTGNKCSGVTTQINMLCEKFKLETLELQEAFNKKQEEQLKARQRKRLLDRGFKGFPKEDPLAEDEEVQVDEEIINDPEPPDFEPDEQNKEDLRAIIDNLKGLIMDGNWRAPIVDDFGFGDDEDAAPKETPEVEYMIPDLLKGARRMPEIVVILKCKDEIAVARNLADDEADLNNQLQAELDRLQKKREDAFKAESDAKKEELAAKTDFDPEDMPEEQKEIER